MDGTTRMLSAKLDALVERTEWPLDVMGILVPLPTIIEDEDGGKRCRSIPLDDDMCEEAPLSTIQRDASAWTFAAGRQLGRPDPIVGSKGLERGESLVGRRRCAHHTMVMATLTAPRLVAGLATGGAVVALAVHPMGKCTPIGPLVGRSLGRGTGQRYNTRC